MTSTEMLNDTLPDICQNGNFTKEVCGEPAIVGDFKWWCEGLLVSIVGPIGLIGNTLALIVLSRPSLRDVFHQLLFALACFDTLYIVCGGINYTFRGFSAHSDIYNYLFPYFLHPFTHIAMAGTIFMTLAISFERYLGLCHPLLNPHSRKAWFYILPVVVIAVTLNVPKFFELKVEEQYDQIANETYMGLNVQELRKDPTYIIGYIMWTRLFSTGLIPVIGLLFFNICIIHDIFTSSQRVQRFGSARRQRKEINLSAVLLCICFVFFLSHAPRVVLNVIEFFNRDKIVCCKPVWYPDKFTHALRYISDLACIVNSSLNFFVYCFVGHTFRRELCRTLGLQNRGMRGDNMVSRRSSRLDYTMSNINTKITTVNGNGKRNGSVTVTPNENGNQETANLITIEATEDMIKVESHQL